MTKALTPAQIAAYAYGAGFRDKYLVRAVAVALAESGGRVRAVGRNSDSHRSRDRGLWQINDYWHREVSDAEAFDPAAAARHAFRISKGGRDWHEWTTWRTGAAAAQYGRARLGIAQMSNGAGSSSSADPALFHPGIPIIPPGNLIPGNPHHNDTVGPGNAGGAEVLPGMNMTEAVRGFLALTVRGAAWISDAHNWQRIAMVAGGTVGVLIALRMIAESGAAGSTAQSAAAIPGNVAKVGAQLGAAAASGGASVAAKTATTAGKAAKAAKAAA